MTWPVVLDDSTLAVQRIDKSSRWPWGVRHLPSGLLCCVSDPQHPAGRAYTWASRARAEAARAVVIASQDPGFRACDVAMSERRVAGEIA